MNDSRPALMPQARKDQLVIKELPDETLVYDLETDKAHCLNNSAALVWKHCDGTASVSEIAGSLSNETEVVFDENVVWLALDQLEKFKLLEVAPPRPVHLSGISRRQLVRMIGVGAFALPVIVSITSPFASQSQTCVAGPNAPCTVGGVPCCPPRTCQLPPSGPGPTICRP